MEENKFREFAFGDRVEKDGIIGTVFGKSDPGSRYIGVRIIATGRHKFWPVEKMKTATNEKS